MSDTGMTVETDNAQMAEEPQHAEAEEADNQPATEGAVDEAGEEETAPEDGMAIVPVQGKKRKARVGEDGVAFVKRPRWQSGDKSFEELTILDIETLVRKVNSLEQQVEANAEAAQQLKESKKRERELERQLEEVGPKEVALAKSSITKQFLAQMTYVDAWNTELKNGGREVMAFLPNVSGDLLVALGGDVNLSKTKQTKIYFEKVPSKTVPQPTPKELKDGASKPGGPGLVISPSINLKYIKTTHELQIKGNYRFGEPEIKAKGGGKRKKKADAEDAEDGAAAEDEPTEEVDGVETEAVGGA